MAGTQVRILLDQGLPRDAAEQLRAEGVECTHVGELGMASSSDAEIVDWARAHGSAIITLDADFHAILTVNNASEPSVARIRMQGLDGTALARLVKEVLKRYSKELIAGCMITVKQRKTTCRLLPVRG